MDCLSSEKKRRNDYFLKMMQDRSTESKNIHRILLIGTGESGKSTFVKQLKLLSSPNQQFPESYKLKFIPEIQRNIVQSLSNILMFMTLEDIPLTNNSPEMAFMKQRLCSIWAEVRVSPDNIANFAENMDSTKRDEFYDSCSKLWSDSAVKETQLRGNEFQQIDSAQYFLDMLTTIGNPSYMPSDGDILQCRTKTLGIHTEQIIYNNIPFELVDVGGQREQRAKWIEAMTDGVTAVIFLTDVSAYDTMLEEDNSVNRLRESYHLLGQVWTKSLLKDKSFILFLNKQDKLASKVRAGRNKIENFFPEYNIGRNLFSVEILHDLKNSKTKKSAKGDSDVWDKHFSYFLPTANTSRKGKSTVANLNLAMDTQVMTEYGQVQSMLTKIISEGVADDWALDGADKNLISETLSKRKDFVSFVDRAMAIPLFEIVSITHFIKTLFMVECDESKTRHLYPYPTTAIDKRNTDRVFESCKEILQGKAITEMMV